MKTATGPRQDKDILKSIHPSEWIQKIKKIEDDQLMRATARIVWWDIFADREFSNRWPQFDSLIKFDPRENENPVPRERLIEALIGVGYTPQFAAYRLRSEYYDAE